MTRAAESKKQFIMEMGIIVWNFQSLRAGDEGKGRSYIIKQIR